MDKTYDKSEPIFITQHENKTSTALISIKNVVSSRAAFEPALQKIINSVLMGNETTIDSTLHEIFSIIEDPEATIISRRLAIELLDSLVVLDGRCMTKTASHPIRLEIIRNSAQDPDLAATTLRVLDHWETFLQQSVKLLPPSAKQLQELIVNVTAKKTSSFPSKNEYVSSYHKQGRDKHLDLPIVVHQFQCSSSQSAPPTPISMAKISKAQEALTSAASASELLSSTLAQAEAPGALSMIQELLHHCEREQNDLQAIATEAVERGDMNFFSFASKTLDELGWAINMGKDWIKIHQDQKQQTTTSIDGTSKKLSQRGASPLRRSSSVSSSSLRRHHGTDKPTKHKHSSSTSPNTKRTNEMISLSPKRSLSDESKQRRRSELKNTKHKSFSAFPASEPSPVEVSSSPPTHDFFSDPFNSTPNSNFIVSPWDDPKPKKLVHNVTNDLTSKDGIPQQDNKNFPFEANSLWNDQSSVSPTSQSVPPPPPPPFNISTKDVVEPSNQLNNPTPTNPFDVVNLQDTTKQNENDFSPLQPKKREKKKKHRKYHNETNKDGDDHQVTNADNFNTINFVEMPFIAEDDESMILKKKIQDLKNTIAMRTAEIRHKIHQEFQQKFFFNLKQKADTYEKQINDLRTEGNIVRNKIEQKDAEIKKLTKTLESQEKKIELFEFDVKENEQQINQAKELWMKESCRATSATDNIDELEQRIELKERQLTSLANKYDELQDEMHALKLMAKNPGSKKNDYFNKSNDTLFESHSKEGQSQLKSSKRPAVQFYSTENDNDRHYNNNIDSCYNPIPLTNDNRSKGKDTKIIGSHNNNNNFNEQELNLIPNQKQGTTTQCAFEEKDLPLTAILLGPEERESLRRFQELLLNDNDVLYESPLFQIGMKATYQGSTATIQLYFGNKSSSELQGFASTIHIPESSEHAFKIQYSQLPTRLAPKQQLSQSLIATCLEPFEFFPTLRIRFLLPDNHPTLTHLSLPVGIFKFMRGHHLNYETFFRYWKHHEFVMREVTAVINLDQERFQSNLLSIATAIQLNGALSILSGIDKSENNMVFAGTYPADDENTSTPLLLVLVRYESGSGKYKDVCRLSVRSDSILLSRAVREALVILLSLPSKTFYPKPIL